MLREHFPQVARSRREEVLPPELEEIFEPRRLGPDEDVTGGQRSSFTIKGRNSWEVSPETLRDPQVSGPCLSTHSVPGRMAKQKEQASLSNTILWGRG